MPDMSDDPIAEFLGIAPAPINKPIRRPHRLLNELIVLPGHPYTKKNNAKVVNFTRKDGTTGTTKLPTAKYQQWEYRASTALGTMGHPIAIDEPVNVQMRFYLERDYRVDLSALYEGVQDLLVKAGVLADDNYKIVTSHNGSGVIIDRENPRTEVLITPRQEGHFRQAL